MMLGLSGRLSRYRRLTAVGIAGAFAYAGALAAAQAFVIAPVFGYTGFRLGQPDPWVVLLSAGSYLLSASRLPRELTRPSQIVYWLLFMLVVAPTHTTPLLLDLSGRVNPLPMIVATSLAFTALSLVYHMSPPRMSIARTPPALFWVVAVAGLVGCVAAVFIVYGFRFSLPGLADVYDVRAEYKESTRANGGLFAYPVTWAGEVMGPLFFAIGVVRSNRWLMLAGIACQAAIYSVTGFRSVALLILLLLLLALASRRTTARMVGGWLLWGAFAGIVAITVHDWGFQKIELSSLFVRRLALSPGMNTYLYYEYFVDRPKVHLEYGLLSGILYNPYPQSPAQLLGDAHFSVETSVNANLWADGYANFGFYGLAFFTLCLGALFVAIDGVAQGRDVRFSALVLAGPGFSLVNSALFTAILTHGLWLAVLLLAVAPESLGSAERPPDPGGERLLSLNTRKGGAP
jgi:hypothetical protein